MFQGMDMASYLETYTKQSDDFMKVQKIFAERVLEFSSGQLGLVTNGQVSYYYFYISFCFSLITNSYYLFRKTIFKENIKVLPYFLRGLRNSPVNTWASVITEDIY